MNISNNSTLIILDWDDTLFPTSWVNKNNIEIMNNNKIIYKKYFEKIDLMVLKMFKILVKYGDVLIITNALLNWIEISSRIIPMTNNFMKNRNDIKIVSARGEYSSVTDNLMDWKKMAFQNELTNITKNKKINNIISVGDAEYEYHALLNLYHGEEDNYRLLKSVKFLRYPNNQQIFEQVHILNNAIHNICTHTGHLDLRISNLS
jgi:hypothetical protein